MRAPSLLLCALLVSGCGGRWFTSVSEWTPLTPPPPAQYQRLGEAWGEACGQVYFFLPWHQIYAVGLTERTRDAYESALASVPGATGLVDVIHHEHWRYRGWASERCVTIRGEAIR